MIHNHPDRDQALAIQAEDLIENKRKSRVLPIIVTMLLIAGVALSILLPKIDFTDIMNNVFANSNNAPAVLIAPSVEKELIEATTGEEAQIVVEGADAEKINDALPFSGAPVETALPFSLNNSKLPSAANALRCMTQAIYYEAGFEQLSGRQAVAQVILNRMRHPAFPKSVCGVVYQGSTRPGCQFSFTCDGSLYRAPEPQAWAAAKVIAAQALSGSVASNVGTATHYHANYVSPYWAPKLSKIVRVGAHIFYRWPGNWGRRIAFSAAYSGNEYIPPISSLANINAAIGEAEDVGMNDIPAVVPRNITDRRADNDTGGRIDPTKGWKLSIPMPTETSSAYAKLTAQQDTTAAATKAGNQ